MGSQWLAWQDDADELCQSVAFRFLIMYSGIVVDRSPVPPAKNNCFTARPKMKRLSSSAALESSLMNAGKKMQKQLHLKERTFTSRQSKSCSGRKIAGKQLLIPDQESWHQEIRRT